MKPYGLTRTQTGDTDAAGCAEHGRATGVYRAGKERAYHSLRGGRKNAARRIGKRSARAEGRAACGVDTD